MGKARRCGDSPEKEVAPAAAQGPRMEMIERGKPARSSRAGSPDECPGVCVFQCRVDGGRWTVGGRGKVGWWPKTTDLMADRSSSFTMTA
jgi:hypothetical protein